MPIVANSFFYLVSVVILQIPLMDVSATSFLLPDSFEEIQWHPISHDSENHSMKAKLPGKLEESIQSDQLCFFHSIFHDVHYGLYFNPAHQFYPPSTLEEFIDGFKHLENAEIVALKPSQSCLLYLLQIEIHTMDERTSALLRIYATESTVYFAIVEGIDFTHAADFFQSIHIQR